MSLALGNGATLAELVRSYLEASDEPDPAAIADTIAASIPADLLRPTLAQALRTYVRIQAGSVRSDAQRAVAPALHAAPTTRWEATASGYQRLCASRLQAGEQGWKFLADMTRDDVLAAAAQRIANGEASISAGRRLERLAAVMSSTQVVADLPEALVLEVFA